jgi:hypothetical protein
VPWFSSPTQGVYPRSGGGIHVWQIIEVFPYCKYLCPSKQLELLERLEPLEQASSQGAYALQRKKINTFMLIRPRGEARLLPDESRL